MLNLTQMFSFKPPVPVGGRFAKGYAMSGSKCSSRTVLAAAIEANKGHKQKLINEQAVLSSMKPECAYSMSQIIAASGVSKTSCRAAVARLVEDEAIKRIPGLHCSFYMLA